MICPRCNSPLILITKIRECTNPECTYKDWVDWTETHRVHNMIACEIKEQDEIKRKEMK